MSLQLTIICDVLSLDVKTFLWTQIEDAVGSFRFFSTATLDSSR